MNTQRMIRTALMVCLMSNINAFAQETSSQSGAVYFANKTNEPIGVLCRGYVDAAGRNKSNDDHWLLDPGQEGYLTISGQRIVARKFDFTIVTAKGRSDWFSDPTDFDRDGDLPLPFGSREHAIHQRAIANQRAVTKPVTTTRGQSPSGDSGRSSDPGLTKGEKVGLAALAAAGLWMALKNNQQAIPSNASSTPTAGTHQRAFDVGDYVTNRGFFQRWIGRVTAVDGNTYTLRITWAHSSSPYYSGQSVDFLEDEFKALGSVCAKAMFQGYK